VSGSRVRFRIFLLSLLSLPITWPGAAQTPQEIWKMCFGPTTARTIAACTTIIDARDAYPVREVAKVLERVVTACRNDAAVVLDEGRRLAAGIPGAKFVALESRNHLVLESEPAWEKFIGEIKTFLAS